jgi:hypothetical protein
VLPYGKSENTTTVLENEIINPMNLQYRKNTYHHPGDANSPKVPICTPEAAKKKIKAKIQDPK